MRRAATMLTWRRSLSVDAALRDIIRAEITPLVNELSALRASHAKLEKEIAAMRGDTAPASAPASTVAAAPAAVGASEVLAKLAQSRSDTQTAPHGVPVLWHNPACSKSCAAHAILAERGQHFEIREYLQDKPSFTELSVLRKALALEPIEWARTMDAAWCEYFDNVTVFDDLLPEDDDILRAMEKHPIMIERPILTRGGRAVVGRPPERILELLDDD
jgi:arsenate reductase